MNAFKLESKGLRNCSCITSEYTQKNGNKDGGRRNTEKAKSCKGISSIFHFPQQRHYEWSKFHFTLNKQEGETLCCTILKSLRR